MMTEIPSDHPECQAMEEDGISMMIMTPDEHAHDQQQDIDEQEDERVVRQHQKRCNRSEGSARIRRRSAGPDRMMMAVSCAEIKAWTFDKMSSRWITQPTKRHRRPRSAHCDIEDAGAG